VSIPNVGDHADIRPRDGRQPADLSRMIHAHLDHARAAAIGQPEYGKRHADMVIEIAVRLAHGQFGFQQMCDGILGGGLARAAGHPDHPSTPLLPRPRAQVL